MAYAPLPKLVPIGSPRVTSDEVTEAMFPEVLQLEPVKRLLNQPNIVIKPIKLSPEETNGRSPKGKTKEKRPKPDISVSLVNSSASSTEEEPQFLLSKTNGDCGISLQPIKRIKRECGHSEPCENIVCHVNIRQHKNRNGIFPLIATYVDESDMRPPVSRHCEDPLCDAVSIDHNRCRRLRIELNSIDKTAICDICRITLKNRKTRIYHKNCRRKDVYQHNQVSGAQILKDRMRECEIQMMTALRMKKNEYSDPLSANEDAIETLKSNSELIVIPQTPDFSNQVMMSTAFVLPPQSPSVFINQSHLETPKSSKSEAISNNSEGLNPQNQYIVTTMPQTAIAYPLNSSEFVLQGGGTSGASKPMLMPVRVVPIANLKSEPSLLHQQQGIPKFCIIADNSVPMQPIVNLQTIRPVQSVTVQSGNSPKPIPIMPNPGKIVKNAVVKADGDDNEKVAISKVSSKAPKLRSRHYRKKKWGVKPFQCTLCSKRFTTDWYFKVHVAKHKGKETSKCEICETVFKNNSELKKHVTEEHGDKVEDKVYEDNEMIEFIEEDNELIICENCETTFETHDDMVNHSCLDVNGDFTDEEIIRAEDMVEVEMEMGMEMEMEMERIGDNDDLEVLCSKVNGVVKDKEDESPKEDNKKVGRRKSKQICRVDDDITEELHDVSFITEERRTKKYRNH